MDHPATQMLLGTVAFVFELVQGLIAAVIGAWAAWTAIDLVRDQRRASGYQRERVQLLREALELQGRADDIARRAEVVTGDPEVSVERQRLASVRMQLLELDALPFEKQSQRSKWMSFGAFLFGLAVVGLVIGVGLSDWLDDTDALSTGDGIARVAVVGAAFYAAGQLFRRSTVLQARGQELERAAIGLRAAKQLSHDLESPAERDAMVRAIYESHLTARPATVDNSNDVAELGNLVSRLRGG